MIVVYVTSHSSHVLANPRGTPRVVARSCCGIERHKTARRISYEIWHSVFVYSCAMLCATLFTEECNSFLYKTKSYRISDSGQLGEMKTLKNGSDVSEIEMH